MPPRQPRYHPHPHSAPTPPRPIPHSSFRSFPRLHGFSYTRFPVRNPPDSSKSFFSFRFKNTTPRPRPSNMPPNRPVLDRLSHLTARARKKVRTRVPASSPSFPDRTPSTSLAPSDSSPTAVSSVPQTIATATPDGLWESLHVAPAALAAPFSIGAATTAGVELSVDPEAPTAPIRSRKSNQDCFGVTTTFAGLPDAVLAAVYDGHGMQGRECARLARDVIPRVITNALTAHMDRCGGSLRQALSSEDRRRAYMRLFSKAFNEAERELYDDTLEIQHGYSGTTATCLWIDGSDLFVAWAGDSRAIMGRTNEVGDVESVDLTWDQKPVRVDEKKRVRAAGGRVTRWKKNVGPQRVWLPDEWTPGLAMTRSIGDTILTRYGVFPTPEVTVTRLSKEECFVVAASDGVWEFMSSGDVADFVSKKRLDGCCAETVARDLVNEAVRRWTENESVVDDTTAIVIIVEKDTSPSKKASLLLGRAREDTREFENRSLKDVFRTRRVEIPKESQVGQPWGIAENGKLEPFCPENQGAELGDVNAAPLGSKASELGSAGG